MLQGALAGAAGGGLGGLLGQVGDAMSAPRRAIWSSLGLPESGSELVSNLTGMDADSPWTHALGMGAEVLGDPLTYAGGLMGKLAGTPGELGELGGLMSGGAAERKGILTLPHLLEHPPEGAPWPLPMLNDIRQEAAGAGLSTKQELMKAQDGVWDEFLGGANRGLGPYTRRDILNPATQQEIYTRIQELAGQQSLDQSGLAAMQNASGGIAHSTLPPSVTSARNGYAVANDQQRQLGNLWLAGPGGPGSQLGPQITDSLYNTIRNSRMGPNGRFDRSIPNYFLTPDPKSIPRIIEQAAEEGFHVPQNMADAMLLHSQRNAPEDIFDLLDHAYGPQAGYNGDAFGPAPGYSQRGLVEHGLHPDMMAMMNMNSPRFGGYSAEELNKLLSEFGPEALQRLDRARSAVYGRHGE